MNENGISKRSFANHLASRPAAKVRECVSVAVRESMGQVRVVLLFRVVFNVKNVG